VQARPAEPAHRTAVPRRPQPFHQLAQSWEAVQARSRSYA